MNVRRIRRAMCALVVAFVAGGLIAGPAHAVAKKSDSEEVRLTKGVKPTLVALSAALHKGDIVSARDAYEAYDARWNGMEVYTNFRSLPLYQALELDLQAKIASGLRQTTPNAAAIAVTADALLAKWDEAIAMADNGTPLSPLFDDLAHLRGVRADLRIVSASLTAGDFERAKAAFVRFQKGYPSVRKLVDERTGTAGKEISDGIAQVDAAFKSKSVTVDGLKPLVASLTGRYNYAVNLLNAAARNADLTKKEASADDLKALTSLNDVQVNLVKSLTAWKAGNDAGAAQAVQAAGTAFELVRPALAARNADASLRTTLATYTTLVGAAGSAATVEAANKSVVEAAHVAEQAVVGQFWKDTKIKQYLAGLPKS